MNELDIQYQNLLKDILENGVRKKDRTGTGIISVFGRQIRHDMKNGFPLLTTKKMAWKTIVTELLWFLRGDTNIKFLVDNNCHIWDGDAYKSYSNKFAGYEDIPKKEWFVEEIKKNSDFAKKFGELGPIYGKQWRKWQGWMTTSEGDMGSLWYDQISRAIQLLKTDPDSRRIMVSAWNVGELDEMVLPPCHYSFQIYTRELTTQERLDAYEKAGYIKNIDPLDYAPSRAISLMWNQRSVDTFLGLPFNIASYGLLLMLLGKVVNMVPDQLIGNLGDTHLYLDHLDAASEQLTKGPYTLPEIKLAFDYKYRDGYLIDWEKIKVEDIVLKNYNSHPKISAPLSN